MAEPKLIAEEELAALAKKHRQASGKTRAQAARELGVARPTLVQAEDKPSASLSKLRIRIIEEYSSLRVTGPHYRLQDR